MEYDPESEADNGIRFYYMPRFWDHIPIFCSVRQAASAGYRPKAVSWVLAGGVFAGVLGPQLVQWTMDVWPPYLFALSFAVQAAVALVAMAVVAGVDAPKPAAADLNGGRPLFQIARSRDLSRRRFAAWCPIR
jgi:hypothetical protein